MVTAVAAGQTYIDIDYNGIQDMVKVVVTATAETP
jgi:hypothetical protein